MNPRSLFTRTLAAAALFAAAGVFLCSCGALPPPAPAQPPPPGTPAALPRAHGDPQSLGDLFARVSPSVVVILTEERRLSKERPGEEEVVNSIGTGFVVSEDGLIMTAAHVIEVVDRIVVRFSNGWEEEAEVAAAAPRADVALIRLKAAPADLKAAEIGDSDRVRTGDRVFVVGSPYGIEFTLTAGHVSGRRIQGGFSPDGAPMVQLQTDAAINQGNSGGPMFNMDGQVVGVVSHILTRSGGFEGLGFALSINTARDILLNRNAFWFGVEFFPVSGALARALNIPQGAGLLVQRVALNAPAQRLGMLPGGIPVTVGGEDFFIGGDVVTEDEVIIPSPCWVSFGEQVKLAGARPVFVATRGHQLDVAAVAQAVGPRTRAVLINSPHNPTGAVYPPETIDDLVRLVVKKDLILVSDEAYHGLVYDGRPQNSVFDWEAVRSRVIVTRSFSKEYAMTGFRVGYAVAPAAVVAAMTALQGHMCGNVCTFAQHGALAALGAGADCTTDRLREMEKKRDLAHRLAAGLFDCVRPGGAFYLFPDVSRRLGAFASSAELAAHLLREAGVAVVPGEAFGAAGHLRISYAVPGELLAEGFERMEKAL